MRKYINKLGLLGTAFAIVIISGSTAAALPAQTNAHAQAANSNTNATSEHSNDSDSQDGTQDNTKSADAKLKSCQHRQKAINNILKRIVTRGQNQLTLFNTIANRVETFKTDKNLTVNNYDQLVATLQADQTKASNDLAAMKTNDTLDCTNSDPKTVVNAFKSDLKQETSDLKTYRTDVKNLIVAVKTAAGSSADNTNSTHSTTGGDQ